MGETGCSVITSADLEKVLACIVIVDTAEVTCNGIFVLAAADIGFPSGAVISRTYEVKVIEDIAHEIVTGT